MHEIVGSFISIHDVVKRLAATYQVSFEDAANTLLQEKKEKSKENKPMQILKFIRELKNTEPEAKKFTRDRFRKMFPPSFLIELPETAHFPVYEMKVGDSGVIGIEQKQPNLTEWDEESEALGVCILYALANPKLASKAQALTTQWFTTQVRIEGIEYVDFVELSKKYGFDEEETKGFSCVSRGFTLHIQRKYNQDKIEPPEGFARIQPKETIEERAQRRLKRLGEIVEEKGKKQGAVSELVREEEAAGRAAADRKSVDKDLARAREAEKRP